MRQLLPLLSLIMALGPGPWACSSPSDGGAGELRADGGDATRDARPRGRPDAGDAGGDPSAPSTFERPIDVVFKIHIEPQPATAEGYAVRRDAVEAVREIAERYGARLTIHGNGEFWEHAAEQGDHGVVQAWLAAGHEIGPHMHAVYDADRDAPHGWANASTSQQGDEAFVNALWDDHVRYLRALLPELTMDQATPYDSHAAGFVTRMAEHGFEILGGGRHEISVAWFGHPPFQPFRIGTAFLEEDLTSPVLIVHHPAQLGEADSHGPLDLRIFADNTVAHQQVDFLQLYLARLHAERTAQPDDRLWLFGLLTHDNKSVSSVREQIEAFLQWLTETFGRGRRSLRGHELLRFVTFGAVRDDYEAWEAAHPGVSSFHVPTPAPIDPADATRISEEASRAAYPYPFWGMAQLLAASPTTVVDYVAPVTDYEPQGVSCHTLTVGPRMDATRRYTRWLCWKESDGEAVIDVGPLLAGTMARRWDARTGERAEVAATTFTIGTDPVIFESPSAPLVP